MLSPRKKSMDNTYKPIDIPTIHHQADYHYIQSAISYVSHQKRSMTEHIEPK